MAYEQYKNSGRCLGRILHQLDLIDIPLRIVETVVLEKEGKLTYRGQDFATVEWSEDDVPYFKFSEGWKFFRYTQDIYASRKNHYEFNNVEQIVTPTEKIIKISSGELKFDIILNNKQVIMKCQDSDQGTLHPDFASALLTVSRLIDKTDQSLSMVLTSNSSQQSNISN